MVLKHRFAINSSRKIHGVVLKVEMTILNVGNILQVWSQAVQFLVSIQQKLNFIPKTRVGETELHKQDTTTSDVDVDTFKSGNRLPKC